MRKATAEALVIEIDDLETIDWSDNASQGRVLAIKHPLTIELQRHLVEQK